MANFGGLITMYWIFLIKIIKHLRRSLNIYSRLPWQGRQVLSNDRVLILRISRWSLNIYTHSSRAFGILEVDSLLVTVCCGLGFLNYGYQWQNLRWSWSLNVYSLTASGRLNLRRLRWRAYNHVLILIFFRWPLNIYSLMLFRFALGVVFVFP